MLGVLNDEEWSGHVKIFLQKTLFQTRKQIAKRWMQVITPSTREWMNAVNHIIAYEKLCMKVGKPPEKSEDLE